VTTRKKPPVDCEVCGTHLGHIGKSNAHCKTPECIYGFARRRAFDRVRQVGDCEVWMGPVQSKGETPIVTLRWDRKRVDYRVLQLRDPEPERAKGRVYINLCGTPRCVTVEHHHVQIGRKGQPPSQQILARLPVEPVDTYVKRNKIKLDNRAHKPLQMARKKGYFTVTGADAFCIETLGIHPAQLYGEAFYTAGLEDADAA
jgi:hypothetical protein